MNLTLKAGRFATTILPPTALHFSVRGVSTAPKVISTSSSRVKKALGIGNNEQRKKAEIMKHIFGTSKSKAYNILRENRDLAKEPLERFYKVAEILNPWKVILGDPKHSHVLIHSNITTLKANCDFLLECGVTSPNIDLITRLEKYVALSMSLFVGYAKLESTMELEQRWVSLLPDATSRAYTTDRLKSHTDSLVSAAQVRNVIFASYVEKLLLLPFNEALKIVEEGVANSPISLRNMVATLEFLLNKGFTVENLSASPQLIRCNAKSISLFLDKYGDDFLGQPAREFLLKHPEISCRLDFHTLVSNLDVLLKFGVPKLLILEDFPNILVDDSLQLSEKIQRLKSYPELKAFATIPVFPKLLRDVDTVLLRVDALRAIDKRLITFTALTCSPANFENMTEPQQLYQSPKGIFAFLVVCTGQTHDNVTRALDIHPHRKLLSGGNVKEVIDYLKSEHFTKEQLFNGLQIVLYPVWLIQNTLDQMSTKRDIQPWKKLRKNPYVLALILYLIESQYSFTGNGVFAECKP